MTRRQLLLFIALAAAAAPAQELPPNRWVELRRDPEGARRGSAIRYASAAGSFFLWGFMNSDPELLQEQPLIALPEYDMVAFDLAGRQWRNHLPPQMEREWSRRLPLAYVPRTYSGITTGSERTVIRGASNDAEAIPRPDLNIVFDQVAYRPANNSLYYFTGGLTASYDIARRRWTDLAPPHSPPPVLGGSLAYDPLHDEIVLFGGGHVAERAPDGALRGYTGTWIYSVRGNDWRELPPALQPPPRMASRLVTDARRQALVLFGGDGQRQFLADTWIFHLATRAWRPSQAPGGPAARAGHFTVYDPETGLTLIGGGYNRWDRLQPVDPAPSVAPLDDMWAYDPGADRWTRVEGETPTGFYLTADIAPEKRLIVLVTNTRRPEDRMNCNILFPVRTTYAFRISTDGLLRPGDPAPPQAPIPKRAPVAAAAAPPPSFESLPVNQWVRLPDPGWVAPTRTWGSAAFDSKRGRILYWGGGHCGYEGSDVDVYDVGASVWFPEPGPPSYPERLWNRGVRLAGVTFDGEPWTDHGRKVYAYDPAGDRMIMTKPLRLTTGYEPEWLRTYPSKTNVAPDALVSQPSSYVKYATWTYDLAARRWALLGPAPAGLDTLVSTPHGVMGVNVNWPARLNDAGYQRPWQPNLPPEDNALFLLRGARWERLTAAGPSPQNLYEMTSLVFDTRRDQVILHGAGAHRDELWTFSLKTRKWEDRRPANPPPCAREAVYLPAGDVMLTFGDALWAYRPAENSWRKLDITPPPQRAGQNRAMVYDPARRLVLLVLGAGGDAGRASVFALHYRPQ